MSKERAVQSRLEGYRDEREVKQIQIMPGDMTIKSSQILERLASLRMNITIRLDNDSAYILICIDFAVKEYDNSQEE